MRAVTFQAPMEVRVDERPEPELESRDDAIVAIEASGICGSDLHIYHGRVKMEPGFTIGHEFVGRVVDAGDAVTRVAVGDRVCGCFHTACGTCFFCMRGVYQKCDRVRVFGHGEALGALPGTQADQALVPMANLTLRPVPDGVSDDVALFAGDVMGTAYHAIDSGGVRPGDPVAVLGLGPVGLCAVQIAVAAGAGPGAGHRQRRGAPGGGARLRGGAGPSHRGEPARCGQEAHRGPRRRRGDRRGRPSRCAGPRHPPGAQRGDRGGDRRLRRARARCTWAWSGSRP